MTGREMIIRVVLSAALVATLGSACGGSDESSPVTGVTAVPSSQSVATHVAPVPADDMPIASARGLSVPNVSGLSGLGAGLTSGLPGNVAAGLPVGLESSDGWLEVDLASPERAAMIQELTWVTDGVVGVEAGMVDWLVWTAIDYGEVFDRVVGLDWLLNGVTAQEIQVLKHLYFLAGMDTGFALWLAGQPFLETVEYADSPAVESLLKVLLLVPDQSDLVQALLLGTGGVTDEWAPILAVTWPVARFAPDDLLRLYDPAVVQVHAKLVDLERSGVTLMAVVRTEPGAGETLELVEGIVREVEGTMGRALPLDYVGILFGDAVSPGAVGINYGTGMVLDPRFDVADGSHDEERLRGVLTHEVAHCWWNRNESWVDEGMAEFLAAASYGFPTGSGYPLLREPCAEARSLSELPPEPRDAIRCDYSLGQRRFFSLYRVLREEAFYEAVRRLYDQSRADVAQKSLDGTPSGVGEVREAFGPEGDVAIDRWYDGKGDYELSDF